MSSINTLIKELCPNGVEKVSLGSLMNRKKEKNFENSGIETVYSVTKENGIVRSDDLHDFNVYSSDLSNYYILRLNQYAYNPARLNIGSIARLKEDKTGLVSPMYIVFELDSSKIDYEYYEHLLFSNKVFSNMCSFVEQGARFRFDYKNWDKVIIDLPPLKVQKEIVKILNKFKELERELELELDVRKKQYEFWRGKLFENDFETIRLGDLCSIKTGSKPKELFGSGSYEYINAGTSNSGFTNATNAKGDCVTTPSRGQGGIGFVGYQTTDFWCGPLCYQIRSLDNKLTNKYLYYYMLNHNDFILGLKHEGGVPAVNIKELQEMPIKVPSIDKQTYIVNILNKFDKLVNDIAEGIPAEIELRRKQYEYYRNKLLSFEELSVSE